MPAHSPKPTASTSDKPVPRPPKSPAKLAQLSRQNRRREYLVRHPSYLARLDHELADPVLYERLVRSFQTPAERRAESEAKGFGRTLEADLVRGETKLAHSHADVPGIEADVPWEGGAESREEGMRLWHEFLGERFVRGEDEDFEYRIVDGDDDLDVAERTAAQDAWFDEEDPDDEGRSGETGVQDY